LKRSCPAVSQKSDVEKEYYETGSNIDRPLLNKTTKRTDRNLDLLAVSSEGQLHVVAEQRQRVRGKLLGLAAKKTMLSHHGQEAKINQQWKALRSGLRVCQRVKVRALTIHP